LKSQFSRERWERLLRIGVIIGSLYRILTKPFIKYAPRIITRFPFSKFYFRPLFCNEIYMAFGLWEPYVRANLHLSRGDIFIDVGAHIGYYTIDASRKVGEEGLVIAIEPDRRNLKVLYMNVKGRKNVHVYPAAAGFNGFLYLAPHEDPLLTKTMRKGADGWQRVPSISLNSLLEEVEKISFHHVIVKIDVEEAELDVIRGGWLFLERTSPILIIETSRPYQLESLLKQLGYTGNRLFRSYFMFVKRQVTRDRLPTLTSSLV
jgi:FkbM family methyltransferase